MDSNNDSNLLIENQDESSEACTKRLSRQLSEYELKCIETQGKAKQLRKERDVERSLNDKLRKEVDKLSNQLLRERTKVSCLEKEVKTLTAEQKEKTTEEENDNADEPISSKENDIENPQKPLQQEPQNLLTLKLQELKSAIEDRMDKQGNNQKTEDQFIALSILIEGLQNYMEIERENNASNQGNTDDVIDGGAEPINDRPITTNGRSKCEISMWFKIIVYLGPVFLSVLCYIAFITGKK